MSLRIRLARTQDAPDLARIHVLSWQSAYKGLLPDSLLEGMSIAVRTRQWAEWLQAGEMEHFLVAESESSLIGFATGGALRGTHGHFDCEVAAIYLLPEAQGQGVGRRLFDQMTGALRADGYEHLLVWVLASNSAARSFYERLGGIVSLEKTAVLGRAAEMPIEVAEVGYGWNLQA